MNLSKADKREFDKRYELPDFEALFFELSTLHFRRYRDVTLGIAPLSRRNIKKGQPPMMVVTGKPGQAPDLVLARANAFLCEIDELAKRLVAFFPERKRWHWQELFRNVAINGVGHVRTGAGAPAGSGTWEDAEDFASALNTAIDALRKSGERPTQPRVAEYFGTQGYPGVDDRQIRQWCHDFGIDWKDLIGQ